MYMYRHIYTHIFYIDSIYSTGTILIPTSTLYLYLQSDTYIVSILFILSIYIYYTIYVDIVYIV